MSIWGPEVDARAERRKNAVFGTRRLSNWLILPFMPLDLAAMVMSLGGAQAAHPNLSTAGPLGLVSFFSGLAFAVVVIILIGNASPRVAWIGMGIWLVWAVLAAGAVTGQPALVIAAAVVGPLGLVTALAIPIRALVRGPAA